MAPPYSDKCIFRRGFYQEAESCGVNELADESSWMQKSGREYLALMPPPPPIERNFWQPSHFFNIPNREFSFRPRGNKKM